MKNEELYRMKQGLVACGNISGAKFAYAIGKNLREVEKEIKLLELAVKESDAYKAYDKLRIDMNVKFCLKINGDEPKIVNGQYLIDPDRQEEFDQAMIALKSEHKAAIEEREKQKEDFRKLLEEESTVVLYKVKMESVPDAITAGQLSGIMDIIDDEGYDPTEKK